MLISKYLNLWINAFAYVVYFSYICSMKKQDKKLEIRFYVSEETYKKIEELAKEYEMTIAGFTKLKMIEISKNG